MWDLVAHIVSLTALNTQILRIIPNVTCLTVCQIGKELFKIHFAVFFFFGCQEHREQDEKQACCKPEVMKQACYKSLRNDRPVFSFSGHHIGIFVAELVRTLTSVCLQLLAISLMSCLNEQIILWMCH